MVCYLPPIIHNRLDPFDREHAELVALTAYKLCPPERRHHAERSSHGQLERLDACYT